MRSRLVLALDPVLIRPLKRLQVDADADLADGMCVRPAGGTYVCDR